MRSTLAPDGRGQSPFAISSRKRAAAVIGPIVCELDGPIPILNRSNTERNKDQAPWQAPAALFDISALFPIGASRSPTLDDPQATLRII
jgi:hypothetical protein